MCGYKSAVSDGRRVTCGLSEEVNEVLIEYNWTNLTQCLDINHSTKNLVVNQRQTSPSKSTGKHPSINQHADLSGNLSALVDGMYHQGLTSPTVCCGKKEEKEKKKRKKRRTKKTRKNRMKTKKIRRKKEAKN